jgi:rRNA pseudouridine-1189 N-methylase Emg1 (Nep1/Mra1 family)
MKLLSFDVIKAKRRNKKNTKTLLSKKVEYRLVLELKDKLELLLADNDRTLLEVHPKVVGEFLNVLNDKLLSMYEFEQIDGNKFVFYTKEIDI